jgi:hypothetical protein
MQRMKRSNRVRRIGVASLLTLMLAGCAPEKVPAERRIAEIQATVTAASTEAAKYIPEQFAAVQTRVVALQASFDKKDYAAVVGGAPAVLGAAQSLATDAAARKDEVLKRLSDRWTELAGSVPGSLTAVQKRIDFLSKTANKKAAARTDVDGAKAALGDAMALWSKAQAAFASGNMDEAVNTAQNVKSTVDAVAAVL